MDRPKRAAAKVTSFRQFHLSGDPHKHDQPKPMATPEDLQKQLEEERENSKKLHDDVEHLHLQNELEMKKMKQEQWHTALAKLKEAKEHASQEHSKCMDQMAQLATSAMGEASANTLDWFKSKMGTIGRNIETPLTEEEERQRKRQQEREAAIDDLKKQQEDIQKKLRELQGEEGIENPLSGIGQPPQEVLMQQLRSALSGKKDEDPNKALLRALITQQNKTPGEGGTNTLKQALMNRILTGNSNSMAEWLANLNKQEEGESELFRYPLAEEEEGIRGGRIKSGMLDKATTNIQVKQVWPQQNLGEDWADEDVEFKTDKI